MFVDRQYINLLNFERIKEDREGKFNFRCVMCGDSQSNKNARKAYLLPNDNGYTYYCHRCGYSESFYNFLKEYNQGLWNQYVIEMIQERKNEIDDEYIPRSKKKGKRIKRIFTTENEITEHNTNILKDATCIADMDKDEYVIKYLKWRKIPKKYFNKLWYVDNFAEYVYQWKIFGKNERKKRLIIPFFDTNGKITGFQGRAITTNPLLKYITIMIDSESPKIWGLDEIDFKKTVYVTEGPIDAMFVDNCMAMAGISGDYRKDISKVFIFDNEYLTNINVKKKYEEALHKGHSVFIYPPSFPVGCDLNEAIQKGIVKNQKQLMDIIRKNTFSGMKALIKLKI